AQRWPILQVAEHTQPSALNPAVSLRWAYGSLLPQAPRSRHDCLASRTRAFTGAQQAKPGQIEFAAGEVLCLYEFSTKVTRIEGHCASQRPARQDREFARLGGVRAIHPNVRVIAVFA